MGCSLTLQECHERLGAAGLYGLDADLGGVRPVVWVKGLTRADVGA
jgi:hypothetical protein